MGVAPEMQTWIERTTIHACLSYGVVHHFTLVSEQMTLALQGVFYMGVRKENKLWDCAIHSQPTLSGFETY